jgi:hypothetical protein
MTVNWDLSGKPNSIVRPYTNPPSLPFNKKLVQALLAKEVNAKEAARAVAKICLMNVFFTVSPRFIGLSIHITTRDFKRKSPVQVRGLVHQSRMSAAHQGIMMMAPDTFLPSAAL